jgi:hypothetical protein
MLTYEMEEFEVNKGLALENSEGCQFTLYSSSFPEFSVYRIQLYPTYTTKKYNFKFPAIYVVIEGNGIFEGELEGKQYIEPFHIFNSYYILPNTVFSFENAKEEDQIQSKALIFLATCDFN